MFPIDKMGVDEGRDPGPRPGAGASTIGGAVVGGTDFEGTPGNVLPDRPGEGYATDNESVKAKVTSPPNDVQIIALTAIVLTVCSGI